MAAYVDALLREADAMSAYAKDTAIQTVFIGGGTPSTLPAALLRKLLTGLHERLRIPDGVEFTSEANPGTLTPEWLEAAISGGVEGEGNLFLFGSDSMGRDLFSRIILGSQVSLTIPFAGTAISFVLGILLGSISGYFGGKIDNVIQRIIEVLNALPSLPLWMALSAAIPPNIPPVQMYLLITIILSLISWTGLARVVRGKFMSLKNEDFVMAAKLAGVSDMKIILKHLVPGFMSYLIVSLTMGIPGMIIGETSMSFLGLGIQAPATSWGVLLKEAQSVTNIASYPWRLIPLIFVVIAVLAFNFLGDGMRDAADPYK